MVREPSICRAGSPFANPHWTFGDVVTACRLVPALASMTMRNVPPSSEKICGVGPGVYGVGVGNPVQSHPGFWQNTQPSLVAIPKYVTCGPIADGVDVKTGVLVGVPVIVGVAVFVRVFVAVGVGVQVRVGVAVRVTV